MEKIVIKNSSVFKSIFMTSKMHLDLFYVVDESGNLTLDFYNNFIIKEGSDKVVCLSSRMFKIYSMESALSKIGIAVSGLFKQYKTESLIFNKIILNSISYKFETLLSRIYKNNQTIRFSILPRFKWPIGLFRNASNISKKAIKESPMIKLEILISKLKKEQSIE